MLAVVSWQCDCGVRVKAMYDTDGKVMVRCPEASCQKTHTVVGKISNLWINNSRDDYKWTEQDVARLIVQ